MWTTNAEPLQSCTCTLAHGSIYLEASAIKRARDSSISVCVTIQRVVIRATKNGPNSVSLSRLTEFVLVHCSVASVGTGLEQQSAGGGASQCNNICSMPADSRTPFGFLRPRGVFLGVQRMVKYRCSLNSLTLILNDPGCQPGHKKQCDCMRLCAHDHYAQLVAD